MRHTAQENAEFAEAMADALDVHGHCTGNFRSLDGRLCLIGAARWVQGYYDFKNGVFTQYSGDAQNAYYRAVEVLGIEDIAPFNDGALDYQDRGPLSKETAIELCISRAKFWREQG